MTDPRARPAHAPGRDAVLRISAEVAEALAAGTPVVALESTIITAGMPFPENLATALAVEATVRRHGAVPATVAAVDGELRVGLEERELDALARSAPGAKASRRDLPLVVARAGTAGTTVAATMFLAHRAGIGVFATGGIGGVHRGADRTFDVSADLTELSVTPVVVVCAGAKSVLDLPATLEVLETAGVPVIGYGTDVFPAFYSRDSGLPVPHRVDGILELAAAVTAARRLGLPSGVVVANPVPAADEIPAAEIGAAIDAAVAAAEAEGIRGRDVTPYLLARLVELTGGRSLETNIALVRNNAALAADLAVTLAGWRAAD